MESFILIGGCAGGLISSPYKFRRTDSGSVQPFQTRLRAFGSLTSSYLIVHERVAIIVDNGLGVFPIADFVLGEDLDFIHVVQTHYHFDHMEAFHMNPIFYQQRIPWKVWLPHLNPTVTKEYYLQFLRAQFNSIYWPIGPKEELDPIFLGPKSDARMSGIFVKTLPLVHPGGSFGYRFELSNGKAVVISTDCELADEAFREEYARFVSGCEILIQDVQFRDEEYCGQVGVGGSNPQSAVGWGHSTPSMLVQALGCCDLPPKVVIATHHDSRRDSEDLSAFQSEFFRTLTSVCEDGWLACEGRFIPLL